MAEQPEENTISEIVFHHIYPSVATGGDEQMKGQARERARGATCAAHFEAVARGIDHAAA